MGEKWATAATVMAASVEAVTTGRVVVAAAVVTPKRCAVGTKGETLASLTAAAERVPLACLDVLTLSPPFVASTSHAAAQRGPARPPRQPHWPEL